MHPAQREASVSATSLLPSPPSGTGPLSTSLTRFYFAPPKPPAPVANQGPALPGLKAPSAPSAPMGTTTRALSIKALPSAQSARHNRPTPSSSQADSSSFSPSWSTNSQTGLRSRASALLSPSQPLSPSLSPFSSSSLSLTGSPFHGPVPQTRSWAPLPSSRLTFLPSPP